MKNKDLPMILMWIYPVTRYVVLHLALTILAIFYVFTWGKFREELGELLGAIDDMIPDLPYGDD